jgi:hypothetical protein
VHRSGFLNWEIAIMDQRVNPQDTDTGSLDNGLTPHHVFVPYDAGRLLAHTTVFGTSPENSIGEEGRREELTNI